MVSYVLQYFNVIAGLPSERPTGGFGKGATSVAWALLDFRLDLSTSSQMVLIDINLIGLCFAISPTKSRKNFMNLRLIKSGCESLSQKKKKSLGVRDDSYQFKNDSLMLQGRLNGFKV